MNTYEKPQGGTPPHDTQIFTDTLPRLAPNDSLTMPHKFAITEHGSRSFDHAS